MKCLKKKAQSAMEYLMTYGWAILIIAVVLGALFSLGVFSSSSFLGTACIPQSGYLCSNPVANTIALTVTVGQATGSTWYAASGSNNINFCFVTTGNSITSPTSGTCPTGTTIQASGPSSLNSGQTFPAVFSFSTTQSIGAGISGQIWAVYATSSGGTPLLTEIGTVTAKVA